MSSSDHPGYLGRWSSGVILLHANWPNYPAGEGPGFGLTALGRFPAGTSFRLVDDIDACALLVAEQYSDYVDPYDSRSFHVAVWHEDLLELADTGLITGARRLTEREYEEQKRDRMRAEMRQEKDLAEDEDPLENLYSMDSDGRLRRAELPSLDTYDDDDEEMGYEASRQWLGMWQNDREAYAKSPELLLIPPIFGILGRLATHRAK